MQMKGKPTGRKSNGNESTMTRQKGKATRIKTQYNNKPI